MAKIIIESDDNESVSIDMEGTAYDVAIILATAMYASNDFKEIVFKVVKGIQEADKQESEQSNQG